METPAAQRSTLILIAGIIWTVVSLGLGTASLIWFSHLELGPGIGVLLAAAGLFVGSLWYKLMFQRLVIENIDRIETLSPGKGKICVFAFQNIRSYFIVLMMMAMGALLRASGLSRTILAPGYLAIAVALLLGSLRYYNHLHQRNRTNLP
jgi:hypothetical protein